MRPLTGGVASDIALVDLGDKSICIKFALPKLKVAADWRAPVHRNAAEYAWLKFAADVAPECAVRVLGHSEERHGFAMEHVSGDGVYLWKSALLGEAPDRGEARAVGNLLGQLHAASASAGFDRNGFDNGGDFLALRIEPYLNYTAQRHPALAAPMKRMAEALHARQAVLIHGDASPKNVLFRRGNPILIDAECATMGDPSFDLAFCMNHLLLKAVHLHRARAQCDLAASMVARPKILFLDEPTTGLDARARIAMWATIRELVSEGATLLLTTQYLEEADELADRIVVIDHGRVIAEGTAEQLKANMAADFIDITVSNPLQVAQASELLRPLSAEAPQTDDLRGHVVLSVESGVQSVAEVVRLLDGQDIPIAELNLRRPTLNDVFLSITGEAIVEEEAKPKRRRFGRRRSA